MLGGLYGDLPQAKAGTADEASPAPQKSSWSSELYASNTKRQAPLSAPSSVLRGGQKGSKPLRKPSAVTRDSSAAGPVPAAMYSLASDLKDEYDPAKPNDYEEVLRRRQEHKVAAEREAERQQQLKREQEEQQQRQELLQQIQQRAMEEQEAVQAAAGSRSDLNVSGEEAYLRRGRGRQGAAGAPPAGGDGEAGSAAERMMAKMGWKAGQGLGQKGQGMTTPLEHRRSKQGGAATIVNAEERAAAAAAAVKKQRTGVAIRGTPTRVVLLRNMVGPGDVDDDLEDEVGEECSKYGNVQRVVIFEVTEDGFPAELAVRIFIEFDRIESATKALVDLEGRFFGGRAVRANFYSEQKLDNDEVAPFEGEDAGQ